MRLYRLFILTIVLSGTPSLGAADAPPTFERDVQPILTRFGCDSGPCHGKARGQNGFALSLFGFDANFDYAAIVTEARGRRIFPAAPEQSLFLLKASGELPHGGGRKLPKGSPGYDLLLRWIQAGTPRTPADAPKLQRITINPTERLMAFNSELQLRVTAHFSDGTTDDVTHLSAFQSNEAGYATVDEHGMIRVGSIPGEAAITARYRDQFAVCNLLVPHPGKPDPKLYEGLPRKNFIDGHVWAKLQQLGIRPSVPASDETYHRRAYLDVIGRLPTPEETRAFLADKSPDKRAKLIDSLLDRPEYADFWANKWADLLRPNPYRVGIKAVFNLDAWLRQAFRENRPYDQFVRGLITAQGSTFRNGAVVIFRDRREPEEISTMVSQLFLGVRLDCAKCHQHPSEIWSQKDFYSFASFFARMTRKGTGLSPPISGSEEIFFVKDSGTTKHPLTGEALLPTPLLGEPMEIPAGKDPREVLADWMTDPKNPYFAHVMVNRVWGDLMGRGLVDPIDDIRATNPPTNAALLNALAEDFKANGYDIKKLIRTITSSHTYALSSIPDTDNASDTRNYSRHYRKRMRAEVLLDAITDVTQVDENFSAMPPGARAIEAWTVRFPSTFLDSFGRPDPNQDPPCERIPETTVVQALHLMNSPGLNRKVTANEGRAAKLAASKKNPKELVEELYLLVYSRYPRPDELSTCVARYEAPKADRRAVTEDLLWALLNTPEFLFID